MIERERDGEGREGRRAKRDMIIKRDCRLCMDQIIIDFKQPELLKKFMTERGRILPRRLSGNCAKHQRQLATAIKRARAMLLVR
ncbi:MAG TPA: 30S ribosomal protein S18 [Verrucomicrobiae bacterium]|nr:30S ribosomal protein S18 [Verrucomicrobiae bacterium]HUK41186.1 30S ribosomal protein S18 [Candidatus Acidoferrales bacterium]